MRLLSILLLTLFLAACGALSGDDVPATLQVEMTAYATESASINEAIAFEETAVVATVAAAETQVRELDTRNGVILATVRAGTSPTQGVAPIIVQSMGDGAMGEMEMEEGASIDTEESVSGGMQFVDITTASSVRQSDGCASSPQITFQSTASSIYLTTRAVNLRVGTQISVDWFYEGELAFQQNWTASSSANSLCIWLYIEPQDVAFSLGAWRATLYADGNAVNSVSFDIVE